MKKVSLSKNQLFIFLIILSLVGIYFILGYFISKNNNNNNPSSSEFSGLSDEEKSNKINEAVNQQSARNSEILNQVSNIETYKNLSKEDQVNIGDELALKYFNEKDYSNLYALGDYLAGKGTSSSIVALKYCYDAETDPVKKAEWLKKLTDEARGQGIIGQGEALPDSYLTSERAN